MSPSPSQVVSPDEELAAILNHLREMRGGEFSTDLNGTQAVRPPVVVPAADSTSTSSRDRDHSAAVEGELLARLRELGFTYPGHVPTLVANAALAYERHDSILAQKYLDQALNHDPANLSAILLRVRIASEDGNLPFARRVLRERIELFPDSPNLHEAYSGVLYLMGEYEEALAELDLVDSLQDESMGTWRTDYHRGLIAEASGRFEEARNYFRRSREQRPDFERASRREKWLDSRSMQDPK
jgi:tetratricopeptide (TPR) repeat protein